MERRFYVYCYTRPECGTPIYIGKGCGDRDVWHLWNMDDRSEPFYFELRSMRDDRLKPVIHHILDGLTEPESIEWEKFFIRALGRVIDDTGPLFNQNLGDLGTAGYKFSLGTRLRQSKAQRGREQSLRSLFLRAKSRMQNGRGICRIEEKWRGVPTGRTYWKINIGDGKSKQRVLFCDALKLRKEYEATTQTMTFEDWLARRERGYASPGRDTTTRTIDRYANANPDWWTE